MQLKKLKLKDKKIFNHHLCLKQHELSVYAFANIYIWRDLFDIRWQIIKDNLCVFFQDKIGSFMYLAPLGKRISPLAIKKAFEIMDNLNKNKDISRIENVEAKDTSVYRKLGLDCREKSRDYLCSRSDLVNLRGDKFKSKRSCFNYFVKNYPYEFLPFSSKDRDGCLRLYNLWARQRREKIKDPLYQGMLEDSLNCLKILLKDWQALDIAGRVVRINNEIRAFTFGFALNRNTFCIIYEITDLSVKGLAQFIFRQFCSELKEYKFINIMDDSGLENLKEVKLSYHPQRLVPAYIAKSKG